MKRWSMILALSLCAAFVLSGCGHKKPENGYVLKTDLAGASIGIVQGITTEQQVQDNIKNAKIKTYNSIEEATQALTAREVNALALDAKAHDEQFRVPDTIAQALGMYQAAYDLNQDRVYERTIERRYAVLRPYAKDFQPLVRRKLYVEET